MDTTIPEISFDGKGVCSSCKKFDWWMKQMPFYLGNGEEQLKIIVKKIKEEGKNKQYDCIVGLSGGIDSSFTLHLVVEHGLRPLVLHMDNGWNSKISISNIQKVVEKLNLNLLTKLLDWEEFKQLQIAFLKSSTPHCEHPTDHAIVATILSEAAKNGIRFIISGSNINTEGIGVSAGVIGQRDWKYIKSINSIYGNKPIRNYPHFSYFDLFNYKFVKRQKNIYILNYIDYNKEKAMSILREKYGWQYYGGKHYESIYTRFFQGYILPVKFGIDKRRAHFSSLIRAGQLTRDEALAKIQEPPYDKEIFQEDKKVFLSKLGLTHREFEEIMSLPIKSFYDFPSYEKSIIYRTINKSYFMIKRILKK